MPIYEYWCEPCGREFEQMRPMSESASPATCTSCGRDASRVPSVFASKENYTIKVPRGQAFRGRRTEDGAAGTAGATGSGS